MPLTLPTFTPSRSMPALPAATVPGLYVHVPFCFHKCHYCDFYSITRQDEGRMKRYVDLLLQEADFWNKLPTKPDLQTIFFGGGTPSLLPQDQMKRLIEGLRIRFDCSAVTEWTIECNPATVNQDYCDMLRGCGINRLSFGAQSFDVTELATLERHHNPDDIPRSLEIARKAGFDNLNIDLIYAIPNQDLASWERSLDRALFLKTQHLSCYGLTYEANTPIAVRKRLGRVKAVDESLELQMLHTTRTRLKSAGFESYEVSNYSLMGKECQHNILYWTGGNYIGLGPSAASHVEGHRWRNRPHLREWEETIELSQLPMVEYETLSADQRAGELAMLMLRLASGLNFAAFGARTGFDARSKYSAILPRLESAGLITIDNTAARVTETGLNVVDSIAAEFLAFQ